jgi:hypothetical protein
MRLSAGKGKARMESIASKRKLQWSVAIVVLIFVIGNFYFQLLKGYFQSDDISWIWFSATKSVGDIFFSPVDYRAIGSSNFTPMLGLSFKVDWLLFRMEPWGYYIHNIIAVLAAGFALFLFMRHYAGSLTSFISFILFLLNPVVFYVTSWSSTRHYIEGLFFALISLYLTLRAERAGKVSLLNGGFYLLSALSKEIYVVLPLITVIILNDRLMQRVRNTISLWIGLLIYSLWRLWILGGMGGYPFPDCLGLKSFLTGIYKTASFISSHFFGSYQILFWIVLLIIIITMTKKIRILKIVFMLVVIFLPILPVINLIDFHHSWARYVFHLSVFMMFVGVLWGHENFVNGGWRRVIVILIAITVTLLFFMRDKEFKAVFYTDSTVAKKTTEEFLYSGKEYIRAAQPIWFYDGLKDVYKYYYGKEINTKVLPEEALIAYLSDEKRKEITSSGYSIPTESNKNIRYGVINGKINIEGYKIKWDFGPYKDGKYLIIRGRYDGLFNYGTPVSRKGGYLFGKYYPDNGKEIYYLRVIYQSPEGWEGISDEYRIEIPGDFYIKL